MNKIDSLTLRQVKKHQLSTKEKIILTSLSFRYESGLRGVWKALDKKDHFHPISNYIIFIAELENKIVGWSIVFKQRNKSYYNSMYYVNKKFRNLGIGKALVQKAKIYCSSKKKKLIVYANKTTIKFFKQCKLKKNNFMSYSGQWN